MVDTPPKKRLIVVKQEVKLELDRLKLVAVETYNSVIERLIKHFKKKEDDSPK